MKRCSAFLLIASFLVTISCTKKTPEQKNAGKLQGLHKYYFPDGKLYLEVNYKDSLPHGKSKRYFKTGQLLEESEYSNGILHGITRTYHENGKLSTETPYDSGRIHGVQRKFRKDGTPAFEAPYHYDSPCVGVREYYTSGNVITKYPSIIITARDELLENGQYTLELRLSDGSKSVTFYEGELTDGKFIGKKATPLPIQNGVGKMFIFLPEGGFMMQKINFIAKAKTDLRNYYITQKVYNLAIENR